MKEPSNNPKIDPELEARIVALVLGEASDFERDQLVRLIEAQPELAAFEEGIQSIDCLLRDVAKAESVSADEDWKLSADKRNAVSAVIGKETGQQPEQLALRRSDEGQEVMKHRRFRNAGAIAAMLCTAGLLAVLAIPAIQGERASNADRKTVGLAYESAEAPEVFFGEETSAATEFRSMDGAGIETADERRFDNWGILGAEFDHEAKLESALSGIRDSLDSLAAIPSDRYLSDDVQYHAIAPNTALPRDTVTMRGGRDGDGKKPNSADVAFEGEQPPSSFDTPMLMPEGEKHWSYGFNGNVDRIDDLQLTMPNAGNKELSFPAVDNGREGRTESEHAETITSTIRVPDGGTVVLGGVKRSVSGPGPGELAGEPSVATPKMPSDYDANGIVTMGDALITEGISPNFDYSIPGARAPKYWKESEASPKMPQQMGGVRYSLELPDPPSVVKGGDIAGDRLKWADGESMDDYGGALGGGGGLGVNEFGVVGGIETEDRTKVPPPSPQPEGLVRGIPHNGVRSAEQPSETRSPAPAGGEFYEDKAGAFYDGDESESGLARSTRMPSDYRKNSREYFSQTGQLERAGQNATGHAARPGDDSLALRDGRTQLGEPLYGRQGLPAITGTPIGAPESKTGQAQVDDRSGYEHWAKDSLGKLSMLNNLHLGTNESTEASGANGTSLERDWSRPQSGAAATKGRTLGLDGPVAGKSVNLWEGYLPPTTEEKFKSRNTAPVERTAAPPVLDEKTAADEAFSTFSLHVSDVSFKLAMAALARGEWPEAAKIRIEEFVNAFDYGDPLPCRDEKVSCRLEQAVHPFLQQRNLLRVSMRTAAAGRADNTPLRLTLLLDNSGSMERIDRQQTVRRAFALLADQLKPIDQITLICFARQPRLLADKVTGAKAHDLVQLVESLPSEGGTNIEAALKLAFEKAREQQVSGAQNRIVLLTDGAVNLGDADPQRLSQMIAGMRDAGIAFDAAGISAEGLNDEILEALTRKGDGRYYLLDSHEAADDGFARQLAGALRPSAKNVKVQIEFNPERVGRYKLLGFEKHRLNKEDFRDDTVDAAEMAAAEAGVAVYQFEAKPDGEGDIGSVSVRFRDVSTGQMVENRWPIPYEADAPRVDQAAPSLQVAVTAALFAATLRGEPLGETVDLKTLSQLIAGLPEQVRSARRIGQLHQMIGQARQLRGH